MDPRYIDTLFDTRYKRADVFLFSDNLETKKMHTLSV